MTLLPDPPTFSLCPAVSGHTQSTPGRRVAVVAVSPSFRRDTATHPAAMAGPDAPSEKGPRNLAVSDGQSCADCGTRSALVFLAMEPGADGRPWTLCGACWRGIPDRVAVDPVPAPSPPPVAARRSAAAVPARPGLATPVACERFVAALRRAAEQSARRARRLAAADPYGAELSQEQAARLTTLAFKLEDDE
jgi:hypothetical protein